MYRVWSFVSIFIFKVQHRATENDSVQEKIAEVTRLTGAVTTTIINQGNRLESELEIWQYLSKEENQLAKHRQMMFVSQVLSLELPEAREFISGAY